MNESIEELRVGTGEYGKVVRMVLTAGIGLEAVKCQIFVEIENTENCIHYRKAVSGQSANTVLNDPIADPCEAADLAKATGTVEQMHEPDQVIGRMSPIVDAERLC